jgi:hypothetical protein
MIGWLASVLLYRGLLVFVPRYGLPYLARRRAPGAATRDRRQRKVRFRAKGTGFAALFALERSRYRHFASFPSVRIVFGALLALLAVGAYFASGTREGLIQMLIVTTLHQNEANKRRMAWWLCFPYGRGTLLRARFAAVWSVCLLALASFLLAIAAGAAARALMNGLPELAWRKEGLVTLFIAATFMASGSCLMLAQPYTFRSRIFAWLYGIGSVPAFFVPLGVNQWVLTDRLRSEGVGPVHWGWLAAALLVGGAIAYASFRTGARWMHLYLLNTTDAVQRRRAAGGAGKI